MRDSNLNPVFSIYTKYFIVPIISSVATTKQQLICLLSVAYSGGYPFSISGDIRSVPS